MQKKGIEQTTIADICKKANVSVGSFYNYFNSKDEVLYAVYQSADQYFEDIVEDEVEGLPVYEKIITFIRHYAKYNLEQGLDFITHLYFNSENKHFLERDRYMHVLMKRILAEAQDNLLLTSDLSADEINEFFFLVARGVVSDWCLNDGNYDLEERMVFYFELMLKDGGSLHAKT